MPMPSASPRYCVNCKHHRSGGRGVPDYCIGGKISLVTGLPVEEPCHAMRKVGEACGLRVWLYEPKGEAA